MAESSKNPNRPSATAPKEWTALCQFYPYTGCTTTFNIVNDDKDALDEWTKHVRRHYRNRYEDMPQTLYCWLSSCPRSKKDDGFKAEQPNPDIYLRLMENFRAHLDHMAEHFRNDPTLTMEDLRRDDTAIVFVSRARGEMFKAYKDGRLPQETFMEFCKIVRNGLGGFKDVDWENAYEGETDTSADMDSS
ncbi:hypothetical protein GE09DRAFT_1210142 [Coniochaeta sp. 2T2.1]|nr:hypothetical protein GE09DRAFT_1210142 [Coniochaeta sp. 2T2.1]